MHWTNKVGRKQVGRKLGSRIVLSEPFSRPWIQYHYLPLEASKVIRPQHSLIWYGFNIWRRLHMVWIFNVRHLRACLEHNWVTNTRVYQILGYTRVLQILGYRSLQHFFVQYSIQIIDKCWEYPVHSLYNQNRL